MRSERCRWFPWRITFQSSSIEWPGATGGATADDRSELVVAGSAIERDPRGCTALDPAASPPAGHRRVERFLLGLKINFTEFQKKLKISHQARTESPPSCTQPRSNPATAVGSGRESPAPFSSPRRSSDRRESSRGPAGCRRVSPSPTARSTARSSTEKVPSTTPGAAAAGQAWKAFETAPNSAPTGRPWTASERSFPANRKSQVFNFSPPSSWSIAHLCRSNPSINSLQSLRQRWWWWA